MSLKLWDESRERMVTFAEVQPCAAVAAKSVSGSR
jgi:hypothetical protein